METKLLIVLISTALTLLGWLYQRHKEERFKRLDARRKYFERQIEEFYGPLFTLVHAISTHYEVLSKLTKSEATVRILSDEQRCKIEVFYEDSYFLPLHDKVEEVFRTKLYLIDGDKLPASFFNYLEHSLQAKAQRRIFKELDISTIHVAGKNFPDDLLRDIKEGFDAVMLKYENSTQPLKSGGSRFYSFFRRSKPS